MSTVDPIKTSDSAETDLAFITAEDAIRQFKSKELSPVELMQAVIKRCEDVNPRVNAITHEFFDSALKQARQAEQRYVRGKDVRPLEGIPLANKVLHPIQGVETTWGSRVFEGVPADYTLPALQRLFDAGAIMHIRTNTPEFAHAGHCRSPLHGETKNPWNQDYGSCGSSGGSGAAVSAGMTTLAGGDDGGGSIRMPASACGVFGYKPPYGRNPNCLMDTIFEQILHIGPITRSVGDAALMQNVMNGQHPMDITSLPGKYELPAEFEGVQGIKVAYSPNLGYAPIDPEVTANTEAAVRTLESLGCQVDRVSLDWEADVYDAWVTHWEALFATVAGQHMTKWKRRMDPFVRQVIENGERHSAVKVKTTEFVRTRMWQSLSKIMQDYDVLVCPTLSIPGLKVGHRNDDPEFQVNGKPVDAYLEWALTVPFNLLSQCPAASAPSGFSSAGVPTGLQIVGRPYDDLSVFRVAKAYEAAVNWRSKRPLV